MSAVVAWLQGPQAIALRDELVECRDVAGKVEKDVLARYKNSLTLLDAHYCKVTFIHCCYYSSISTMCATPIPPYTIV